MPTHTILGGKVHLYRRGDGDKWQCSTYLNGKNHRRSTKEDSLSHAEEIAEDWYLELRGKARAGLLPRAAKAGPTFNEAADAFLSEYETSTAGERSARWVEEHKAHLRNHLRPFFGPLALSGITADKVQEYRLHRNGTSPKGKPPARNTIKNELITLSLALKVAYRKGWISGVPDLSPPYRRQMKVSHRPWFSPEEYKQLYTATRAYAQKPMRERFRWDAEQLHDYVLILANTGMRPDEAKNLRHRDVKMVKDDESKELILHIEVRGKRGAGHCKSMPNAVKPYQRLLNRPKWEPQGRKPRSKKAIAAAELSGPRPERKPEPNDLVFPGNHIKVFNKILDQAGLKEDHDGNLRTAYSLRHFYICQRLMEGANIYQIAKNCRTSVEVIERFYAAHIKNTLDASAINIRRPRRRPHQDEARPE